MTAKLARFSDPELTLIADNSMYKIGRAFTHMGSEELADAKAEIAILEGVMEVLRTRH